ncbi:MAG: hypothetical protein ACOYL6_01555 [Bacteriovoracaceae bacterium]
MRTGVLFIVMVMNSACGSELMKKRKGPVGHPFSLQAQLSHYEAETLAVLKID